MASNTLAVKMIGIATLGIASLGLGAGCSEGEPANEELTESDVTAGTALLGDYDRGEGMFESLTFARGRETGWVFSAEQRVQCVRAPCPTVHLEGKFFANATVLALTPTKGARIDTRYTFKDGVLQIRQPKTDVVLASLTKKVPLASGTRAVLASFGLSKLHVDLPAAEIAAQAKAHPGKLSFDDALRAALESFLNDAGGESPIELVDNIDEDDPCYDTDPKKIVQCLVDSPEAELGMLREGDSAEQGESVGDAWIFTLHLPNLSDHGHWAIVDRDDAGGTYNYGFN